MSLTPLATPGRARLPLNAARTSCSAQRDRQTGSTISPQPTVAVSGTKKPRNPGITASRLHETEPRAPNLDIPGRSTGPLTPNNPIGPNSGKCSDNFSMNPEPDLFPPPKIWNVRPKRMRRSDASAESAHYNYSKRYYLPFIPSLDRSPLSEEPETYSRGRYCCACRAIYLLLRVKDNSENA